MFVQRIGDHTLPLPAKATEQSAGFDLRAHIPLETVITQTLAIEPGGRLLVRTGFAWGIPNGMVGMVCSRSGLAVMHGITVLNAPGIIDSDYTGEVGVILQNLGRESFIVVHGERIAQMVLTMALGGCCVAELQHLPLPLTQRGAGGFGSTGNG